MGGFLKDRKTIYYTYFSVGENVSLELFTGGLKIILIIWLLSLALNRSITVRSNGTAVTVTRINFNNIVIIFIILIGHVINLSRRNKTLLR